jgi:hypothetical protein
MRAGWLDDTLTAAVPTFVLLHLRQRRLPGGWQVLPVSHHRQSPRTLEDSPACPATGYCYHTFGAHGDAPTAPPEPHCVSAMDFIPRHDGRSPSVSWGACSCSVKAAELEQLEALQGVGVCAHCLKTFHRALTCPPPLAHHRPAAYAVPSRSPGAGGVCATVQRRRS